MTVLNPKRVSMKCTFTDMTGARDEEREEGWVCEGEKGPGEGEHSLKAYSHSGCSEAWKKGERNGLTRWDVMEDSQGERVGGWLVGSPPLSSQVTVKTRRGRVHTSS